MQTTERAYIKSKRLGVLIGGSGLIGGALMHYFKTRIGDEMDVLSPNSKKLSLREQSDIQSYFLKYRPDFIVNSAIAAIDSDPQLAYEINYMGSVHLARVAMALKIPYIHFSSAAVMPNGENLDEDETLPLTADLANYPKSKLMAEKALKHLHDTAGLDYTVIRLGVVYGKHDHKIQGFHRLFFSIMDEALPVMLTKKGVCHSYSHTKKLPSFVHYILNHRPEFSGKTYNFVDPQPVELANLILTIRDILSLKIPREIYIPYPVAKVARQFLQKIIKLLTKVGIDSHMPGELMFLENFYQTQTLSCRRLQESSYQDPYADVTIFSMLPELIEYYLSRWEHLNLISSYNLEFFDPHRQANQFLHNPQELLSQVNAEDIERFNQCKL